MYTKATLKFFFLAEQQSRREFILGILCVFVSLRETNF
jgi:hypothetical protein